MVTSINLSGFAARVLRQSRPENFLFYYAIPCCEFFRPPIAHALYCCSNNLSADHGLTSAILQDRFQTAPGVNNWHEVPALPDSIRKRDRWQLHGWNWCSAQNPEDHQARPVQQLHRKEGRSAHCQTHERVDRALRVDRVQHFVACDKLINEFYFIFFLKKSWASPPKMHGTLSHNPPFSVHGGMGKAEGQSAPNICMAGLAY